MSVWFQTAVSVSVGIVGALNFLNAIVGDIKAGSRAMNLYFGTMGLIAAWMIW